MSEFNVGEKQTVVSVLKDLVTAVNSVAERLDRVHTTLVETQKVLAMHDTYSTADRMVKDEKDSNKR